MWKRFFGKPEEIKPTFEGSVPQGERVYAIGDIHGRADLLIELLERIRQDNLARGGARTHFVLLGDLVDRGPDSAKVIEIARRLMDTLDNAHILMGNHEEIMLKAAREPGADIARFFYRIGGRETLISYGVTQEQMNEMDADELGEHIGKAFPEDHLSFVEGFEDMVEIGDYLFVHAGINPDLPIEDQKSSDLRWIREPFLSHRERLAKIVVHGHTITSEVSTGPSRIGIDTGAYASGVLTAIGLEGTDRWYIQTQRAPEADE